MRVIGGYTWLSQWQRHTVLILVVYGNYNTCNCLSPANFNSYHWSEIWIFQLVFVVTVRVKVQYYSGYRVAMKSHLKWKNVISNFTSLIKSECYCLPLHMPAPAQWQVDARAANSPQARVQASRIALCLCPDASFCSFRSISSMTPQQQIIVDVESTVSLSHAQHLLWFRWKDESLPSQWCKTTRQFRGPEQEGSYCFIFTTDKQKHCSQILNDTTIWRCNNIWCPPILASQ